MDNKLARSRLLLASIGAIAPVCGLLLAAPPQRARPPEWTAADIEPFFEDAREALVGERPVTPAPPSPGDGASPGPGAASGRFAWSRIIEGEALATEVKRSAARLAAALANPTEFMQGGHNAARAEFALLAVLFGVIDEYDGEVRWHREAAMLRGAFAAASQACREASEESFALAIERRDELDETIRGGGAAGAGEPLDRWSKLADRDLLMQRMQIAVQDGVNPAMADAREFARAAADVQHEAQLLGLLAEVINREEYEYWDDDTFGEYSRELGVAAGELARAAADGNYEAARAAAGRVGQACVTCHDGYRL